MSRSGFVTIMLVRQTFGFAGLARRAAAGPLRSTTMMSTSTAAAPSSSGCANAQKWIDSVNTNYEQLHRVGG